MLSLLRVALGVVLLFYVLQKTGARQAMGPLLTTPWVAPILLAVVAFGAAIEALRLRVLFGAAGLRLGLSGAYRVVMIGTFFNFCIPGGTGGDVVKLYYLAAGNRRRGVEVATVLLVDRVLAVVALLVLVLTLTARNTAIVAREPVLTALTMTAAGLLGGVLVAMAAVGSRTIRGSRLFRSVLAALPLRAYIERATDAAHAFRERKTALLTAIGLSLVGHLGTALMLVIIGSVVLPAVPPLLTALLALMGLVANAVPITPGGLGVGETAFDQLFGIIGASGAAAILIVWRLALVPFAAVGALIYMAGGGRRLSGAAADTEPTAAAGRNAAQPYRASAENTARGVSAGNMARGVDS